MSCSCSSEERTSRSIKWSERTMWPVVIYLGVISVWHSFVVDVHGADTIVSIYPIYTFITDSYLEYKLFPLHCSDGRSYWIGLLLINDIPVLRLAGIYSLRSFIQYWNVHIDEQIQRQVMRYLFHAQTTWLCHTERAPFASIFAFLRTLALTHNSNDWLPEYLVSNFIWKH